MSTLRVTPTQTRALARLESLRKAARQAIEEKGVERFTTADVARLSTASIGTVYRYYPDRVAVLDDLYPDRTTVLGGADRLIFRATKALQFLNEPDSKVAPREKIRAVRNLLTEALSDSSIAEHQVDPAAE